MKTRLTLMIALAVAMLFWSCNIFSPFHSDGSSDDPAVLLSEARSALREGREKEALNMLDRAMAKITPSTPADQAAAIRYFHAVATVRVNNISFQTFIDMMQTVDGGGSPSPQEGIRLFNYAERELAVMLKVFLTVRADLTPVVQALSNGSLTTAQFPYADDAFLSCGVASLVSGFITMMDKDHNPANGFKLDTRVLLEKLNDAYQVALNDPTQASQAIHDELVSIAQQSYSQLEDGFEYLWQYYNTTTFGKPAKGKPPVPPAPLPDNIRSTPSGVFIQIVHTGMSALYHFING